MSASAFQSGKEGEQSHSAERPDEPGPSLAEWMASSNDFLLVKSFGALNVRVIRMKQALLEQKEQELRRMDMSAEYISPAGGFLKDNGSPRERLLLEIGQISKDYNEYILASFAIRRQAAASSRQVRNVQNFLKAYPNVVSEDDRLLEDLSDLISVEERPKSVAQTLAERYHRDGSWSLSTRPSNRTSYYDGSQHGSVSNIIMATTPFIVVTIELAMFLVPLGTLPFLSAWTSRVGTVAALLVAFAAATRLTTTWKLTTRMMAFAGYFIILLLIIIATMTIDLQRSIRNVSPTGQ